MKKFLSIIAAAAAAAVLLAGCTDGADSNSAANSTDSAASSDAQTLTGDGTKSPEGYEKSFDGFVKYMTDNGFISGDGEELTAAVIGAKTGKRFVVSTPMSKHTIELYEYKDQTSEAAVKTIENARKDGSFHLFDSTETVTANTFAAVSSDGCYLMLYTDSSDADDVSEQKKAAAEAVARFS